MSETVIEKCVGCDHWIGLHFNDVTGVARCLWENSGTSATGIIGIPYTIGCNCENFKVVKP